MIRPLAATFAATFAAVLLATGLALPLAAQTMDHSGHDMAGMAAATAEDSPATLAYRAANARMHQEMEIAYTNDADVDFIRGMIPHHQGAVEMAKIVLAHGTDPEVRKLAEGVIAAQEAEITWMQEWLDKHGG